MTEQLQMIIGEAIKLAMNNHHSEICPEHILSCMLNGDNLDGIFTRLNIDKEELIPLIENSLNNLPRVEGNNEPRLNRDVITAYSNAEKEMNHFDDKYMSSGVLLICLFDTNNTLITEIKNKYENL